MKNATATITHTTRSSNWPSLQPRTSPGWGAVTVIGPLVDIARWKRFRLAYYSGNTHFRKLLVLYFRVLDYNLFYPTVDRR